MGQLQKVRMIRKKDLDALHQRQFDFGVVFVVLYLFRILAQLVQIVATHG